MKSNSKKTIFILLMIYAQLCFIIALRTNIFSIIQSDYNLDYSHIATLVLVSGILMQLAIYLSGHSIKRLGHKPTLYIGMSIVGISILSMITVKSIFVFDTLFTIYMFGFGFCILALNMYTGVLAANRGKALMILHFGASIGFSIGPKMLSELMSRGITWQMIISLSSIPVFILLILLFLVKESSDVITTEEKLDTDQNKTAKYNMKSTVVIMFIFIYISAQIWEYGVGTWFIIYARKTNGLTEFQAANYLTLFLVCFPISRLLLSKVVTTLGEYKSLLISFCANFALILLGLVTGQLILISLTGIFTSLTYPLIMTMMQENLGEDNAELIGWISMMGGMLQYVFMWFVGKLGDIFGIQVGFGSLIIYTILGALSIIVLQKALIKERKQQNITPTI
ncbi:MFS transporter [Vallitalea okinawensis]|uniref:MFS transporter n=1 Tax=Vallitalea okinawensis TaxID=2078660 RepID=UPI000CFD9C6E|nr:MFS transporter [Vallitalea okinawensis]